MSTILEKAAQLTPSARQMAWQQLELTAFIHFTVNTFTDLEWGEGDEDPKIFNPVDCDPRQWVRELAGAGFKLAILTAKHHDGFCLWPTKYSAASIVQSPWRDGQADIVRLFVDACNEYGIKPGLYLSPWDRRHPDYGTDAYNDYYVNQLTELMTEYGQIDAVWFDGACGEGPNGKKQVYDWNRYYAVIRQYQPQATIHVCGPDVRWCGNEAGKGRLAEWSVVNCPGTCQEFQIDAMKESLGELEDLGAAENLVWYQVEVDTSIRPGWFYHAHEDDKVKSLDELWKIYLNSVGNNAVLLLNIPPDRRGLFADADVRRLREFGSFVSKVFAYNLWDGAQITADSATVGHEAEKALDGKFDSYFQSKCEARKAVLEITTECPVTANVLEIREYIEVGQRISDFALEYQDSNGNWHSLVSGRTVGYCRLVEFPQVTAQKFRLTFEARFTPTLRKLGLYKAPSISSEVANMPSTLIREKIEWSNLRWNDADKILTKRILLIGDSIVVGHGDYVHKNLFPEYCVDYLATAKCVSDRDFGRELDYMLSTQKYDAVLFNNGLHGWDIDEETYVYYCTKALKYLQSKVSQVFWRSSTPWRKEGDLQNVCPIRTPLILKRNSAMAQAASTLGIKVLDLYGLMVDHPEYFCDDAVHYIEEGKQVQGKLVSDFLKENLT